MTKAFTWLPTVESCCFCIKNLKLAALLIVNFSCIQVAQALTHTYIPFCSDMWHDDDFGRVIHVFAVILLFSGLSLFVAIVIVQFAMGLGHLIVKPYIILTFATSFLEIFYALLLVIKVTAQNYDCDNLFAVTSLRIGPILYWDVISLVIALMYAPVFIYLAIVVNSYAIQWEE